MSTKFLSRVFVASAYVFFLTVPTFAFDLAQRSQNSSVPVSLTPRAPYVKRNNFLRYVSTDEPHLCPLLVVGLTSCANFLF